MSLLREHLEEELASLDSDSAWIERQIESHESTLEKHRGTLAGNRAKQAEIRDALAKLYPSPRVWQSSADIPEGVVAVSSLGHLWKTVGGCRFSAMKGTPDNFRFATGSVRADDKYEGPFTEILEESK